MKVTYFAITLIIICSSSFIQGQNKPYWGVSLKTERGYNDVPHANGDDKITHQFSFELGLDRSLGKHFGIGLGIGYNRIEDEQGVLSGSYSNPQALIDLMFDVDHKLKTDILTVKISPFLKFPIGQSSLTFRPEAGLANVKTHQNLTYSIVDNGTASTKFDHYDYERETLPMVGLSGEYTYHFNQKWGAFFTLSYERLLTQRNRYSYSNEELPISEFPEYMGDSINEIRTSSESNLHRFGDFTFLQIGLGGCYSF